MAEHTEEKPFLVPDIMMVRGFPVYAAYNKEIIEEIFDFKPSNGDVIIASYPKTGTTWMCSIVLQILTNAEPIQSFNEFFFRSVPYLEMTGIAGVEALVTKPRVYKHHFPYHMINRNPNSKIIYVYRKPEDAFISYYSFLKSIFGFIDFDTFLEDYLSGNVSYGRYFEHVQSYLEHKDDKNILLISYEDLHKDRKKEILKVAKFLDEKYYKNLVENESLVSKIIEYTSFEYMKNFKYTLPKNNDEFLDMFESPKETVMKEVTFFRKGKIGEGKSSLNESQLQNIKETAKKVIKQKNLLDQWF